MLEVGQKAPDFKVQDTNGNTVELAKLRGKKVVLYFYPKDDTPGCTKEACSFRDSYGVFQKREIVVLGVSLDGQQSHQAFTAKYHLPFPLLVDTDARVSSAYGVYREKEFMGKKSLGIVRTTFIIDEQGVVRHILRKVNTDIHSQEVLEAITKLPRAA
ncbi:MAG: thioredoxin-dependent thiol peroxidase [Deinococcus sp.]|nr:thioredoxin-dependent thiol peroxidase [Deinococcus sp.]